MVIYNFSNVEDDCESVVWDVIHRRQFTLTNSLYYYYYFFFQYGICGRQFETLKGWHISRTRKEDGRYSSLDEAAAACPSSPSSSSGKDIGVTDLEKKRKK